MRIRNISKKLALLVAAVAITWVGHVWAGPVIIGGDDLTDHGRREGGLNKRGWLYIENAIADLQTGVTRAGPFTVDIVALGSGRNLAGCNPDCSALPLNIPDPGINLQNAGSAIGSAAEALGKTIMFFNGAGGINSFFSQLAAGTINPEIIWIAGTGAANDLGTNEGLALTNNAAAINAFVLSGGGLMAHGSGVRAYGWLSALLPGLIENTGAPNFGDCTASTLSLTPAGQAAFPTLSNSDIRVGQCHSNFTGDLGGLRVLVVDGQGRNIIIGGVRTTISRNVQTLIGQGSNNSASLTSEPVNTATGNYFYQRTDLAIPGRGIPLIFTRSYNSQDPYVGPLGHGWTHSFNILLTEDPGDGSVGIKQADGHSDFYTPTGGGSYEPQFGGAFDTLVKNPDGTFTLTKKNQSRLMFDVGGKLTSITDRNNNTITLGYDGAGNLTTITDTVGRTVILTYDASNQITQLTDPIGRTVVYSYDGDSNLASVTDPNGSVMTFAYDGDHNITEITDERGNTLVANTYDGSGRVETQTNGRGFTTSFDYGTPNPGDTTVTDPRGFASVYRHDSFFRLSNLIDSNGKSVGFTYDDDHNRTSITDQNGNTTQFTYDTSGNVTSITDPLTNAVAFTYDSQNNLTSATNARGFVTTFGYDGPGNLTGIQDALGNTTAFAYDGSGQLKEKTDARGNVTQYAYDAQANVNQITDALSGNTTLAYGGIGRLLSLTDPSGNTATSGYDLNSRLTQIIDPLGNTTGFGYDPVGNLTEITDAKANKTLYGYDEVNNLTVVTDALSNVTQYAYDANNNRIAMTNANSQTTSYTFDALNRLASISDPLGNTTSYSYDPVGNVTAVTDANGITNTFGYDDNNRLTGIAYGDGTSVDYTYDPNGNRVTMVDSRGTTTYTYDALDRLTEVVHPASTVAYAYDAVGNRTSVGYPDGTVVSYGYDALNRLSEVTDPDGKVTTYSYDPSSNLAEVPYPNRTSVSYEYDAANRLVTIENKRDDKQISSFEYNLDALGNRIQMIQNGRYVTEYTYDALSQLVSVEDGRKKSEYIYDPVGNRLSMKIRGKTTNYTYDEANRLLNAGKTSFVHDANGNRIRQEKGRQAKDYEYDAANRLTHVIKGKGTIAYEYDGDGNKVGQTITRKRRTEFFSFINDVATTLPVVLTENGSKADVNYVYGLGLISQAGEKLGKKKNKPFEFFYHFDGLGSVVNLSDNKGKKKKQYDYDAWGEHFGGPKDSDPPDRFRFTGEELDADTGLYYLRARWYDPKVGRFLNKDPFGGLIAHPETLNKYTYTSNNPVNLTDPTGLISFRDAISEFTDLGGQLAKSVGKQIGVDILRAAGSGIKWVYKTSGDIGLIFPAIKGSLAQTTGGWNILNSLGKGIGNFISKKVVKLVFSQGGRTEVRDIPILSEIPIIGLFFSSVPVAGEVIDEFGNVYGPKGNIIGNINIGAQKPVTLPK